MLEELVPSGPACACMCAGHCADNDKGLCACAPGYGSSDGSGAPGKLGDCASVDVLYGFGQVCGRTLGGWEREGRGGGADSGRSWPSSLASQRRPRACLCARGKSMNGCHRAALLECA
jgi:hypothetical protein